MLEFIERLYSDEYSEERWLVHAAGNENPHVAWIFLDEDREYLRKLESATRPWVGPIHPRVSTIFTMSWHGHKLVLEVDDDRGPMYWKAAAVLEDPIERERWAVAQIIAIADGLATLRSRDRSFVHRQLDPDKLFVDVGGRARLRAPIPFVMQGPHQGRVGAGVIKNFPHLMSPEQAKGMPLTAASDVFTLAGNLYMALSGKRPFQADTDFDTLKNIVSEQPAPVATHATGLGRLLERAFVKEPKDRIPDPGAFAGELWQCVPDAVDYDECISDRIVTWRANAPQARREHIFDRQPCKMKWNELAATATSDVRHCGSCKQDVVKVTSLAKIVPLAGRCVWFPGEN